MQAKVKTTILFMLSTIYTSLAQIDQMPPYEVYTPEYQTYRFEKELYSFNLIDYMFEDKNKKIWLSTVHDLKRTNGYQFFNISQILLGQSPLKGHIIDGQHWNDSTQYLVEQIDNQKLRSHALAPLPPIKLTPLDSNDLSMNRLLFYDVLQNENAYEIWSDSTQNLFLKIVSSQGKIIGKVRIPEQDGELTDFCTTKGQIWLVIDRRRILTYEISENLELTAISKIQSPRSIRLLHSDQYDNIWVTSQYSTYQIRKFTQGFELSPELPLRNINRIFEDNHGNLILGSVAFPNNIVSAYLYLREGGRWITLESLIDENHDLHYFAGENFQKEIFLSAKNNFSSLRFSDHPICNIVVDHEVPGKRWNFISRGLYKSDSILYTLVTNKGMMTKNLMTGKEELIKFRDPITDRFLKFDCLRTIEVDSSGMLWFTTCESLEGSKDNNLIRYNPRTEKSKVFKIPHPIAAIQMGKDSILWLANVLTENSQKMTGFDVHQNKILFANELPQNIGRINDIQLISKDTLMLGSDIGLYEYSISKNSLISIPLQSDSKIQTTIFSIFPYDQKYFLASRDGLFIYTPGQSEVKHFTMDNGLKNNIVTAVFRERKNKYWLGTFFGLTMLNLDENLILNYSTRDGLPENEFNLYSYFQDKTGYYLGYPNGVIKLNLRDSMVSYFSDYGLDHALVYGQQNEKPKVLFPQDNHLTIPPDISYFKLFPDSYASYFIDYFYYKLINSTRKDTTSFSAVTGAILSNLDAGNYNYSLHTYDRYGNKIPGEKKFTISVQQYFYKATWFRLLILLLGNIIIGLLIYWWLRTRNRKKRKTNELAKHLSELELQVLQAQLNPHFIFNTISAIQYYIQDHDEERADMYLTSFSRLMRMYLDSSKSSYIPLSTEIALLTNYLDLEIMVSDGLITAHYEVDPAIDLENVVIPTMILQPFVENAIQHGLFHKKSKGNIYIRFIQLLNDTLLCEIEDDGIGRQKAALINQDTPQKHTSRALQIINEKLEVLKATQDLDIEIEIIDKYHNGIAKGTLVQIRLPVIQAQNVNSLVKL